MTESSPLLPVSPYGVTKCSAEQLVYLYHRNFGLPTVSLRFFTVYGPGQRPDMAFHKFFKAILEGREIPVFGDGSQTRDFTYVDDIVEALIRAERTAPAGEVYNVGGGHRERLSVPVRPFRRDHRACAQSPDARPGRKATPPTRSPRSSKPSATSATPPRRLFATDWSANGPMSAIFTEGAAALRPKDDLMKTIKLAVLVAAALLAAAACTPQKNQVVIPPDVASSDEALFREGERLMKRDPERALLYFRQIQESFSRSFFAQRAMLAIGDTYFEQGDEANLILAAAQYRSFLNLYPTSPSAPLAQYRVGLCSYKNMLKAGRDQTKTEEALAEFKKTVQLFPLAEEAKLAREKIKECEDRLAEHLFGIGDYYYRAKSYKAAIVRLNEILAEISAVPRAWIKSTSGSATRFSSGETPAESVPYFTKLVTDYATEQIRH